MVSWNTRALLADCLAALHDDVRGGMADVWVHDNASNDGSADMVRERFPFVKLIASSENIGFGAGVNSIAARTRSPWIAPANADTRVLPGALARLLEAGNRHPRAALLAPRLLLPEGGTQHSAFPFPSVPFTLAYVLGLTRSSRRLARHWSIGRGFDPDQERDVAWAVGAFLLVRRSAWEQVGGFDPEQWMYAEDVDLGWRLRQAGWTTRYIPSANVSHAESAATIQAWGDARHSRWHASTYAWLARRRGSAYSRLIAGINVAGFGGRAAALSLPAMAGSRAARAARAAALNAARAHAVGLRSRRVVDRVR